jgi:hypothetical protein
MSLCPNEGGSCSSKMKHDRRTTPRSTLFVSHTRLQKHKPQPREISCVRVQLKTLSTTEERRRDKSCFDESTEAKATTTTNLLCIRVSIKMVSVAVITSLYSRPANFEVYVDQYVNYRSSSARSLAFPMIIALFKNM